MRFVVTMQLEVMMSCACQSRLEEPHTRWEDMGGRSAACGNVSGGDADARRRGLVALSYPAQK